MPGVEEENRVGTGAAPFSPFLPAGIAAGAEEDTDAEQHRKREHRGAGWDVGVRAGHKERRIDGTKVSRLLRRKQLSICQWTAV